MKVRFLFLRLLLITSLPALATTRIDYSKHALDIFTVPGIAEPDPCKPALCHGHAFVGSILHTQYNHQPFDASNGGCSQYSADYCYDWMQGPQIFDPIDGNASEIFRVTFELI